MLDLVVKIQERLEKWYLTLSPGKQKFLCVSACIFGIFLIAAGGEIVWYFQNAEALAHRYSNGSYSFADFALDRFWHFFATITCLGALALFGYMLSRREAVSEDKDD